MADKFPQAVIFDMDGVLVDVSMSYRQAIARTVETYLVAAFKLSDFTIKPSQIATLKLVGGFNNDWDASAGLITLALAAHFLPPPAFTASADNTSLLLKRLNTVQPKPRIPPLSLDDLLQQARTSGQSGFDALAATLPDYAAYAALVQHTGDLRGPNLVQRIFQELYLGAARFEAVYGEAAMFHQAGGLIEQERLIISPATLQALSDKGIKTGIATGRPRLEAEYASEYLLTSHNFGAMVTDDDKQGQPGKPHPFILLETARRLGLSVDSGPIYYLGDTPDDVTAANRAKATLPAFVSVGLTCALPPNDPAALAALLTSFQERQADFILPHPDDILSLW